MSPSLLVLMAIFSIQFGAAIAVHLFVSLPPTATAAWRVLICAGLLLIYSRPRFSVLTSDQGKWILAFGLALACLNFFFYQAIARIPLGVAVAIEFMGPLGLAVLSSRKPADFAWIGLAVCGIALLAPAFDGTLDPVGVLSAAFGGLSWASFVVLSGKMGRIFPSGEGLTLGMIVAATILMPFGWSSGETLLASPTLLLGVLFVAVFSTTLPFRFEYEALKRLPARSYGVLISLEPAVATLVGVLFLGDVMTTRRIFALTCVTVAAVGVSLHRKSGGCA